ncbi:MAG: hypothetical protein EP338_09680 [Bacteroidetes bacterium]|nr:MAG: hypothetical protein EP338_09680 [Bacteroidota bacterium]
MLRLFSGNQPLVLLLGVPMMALYFLFHDWFGEPVSEQLDLGLWGSYDLKITFPLIHWLAVIILFLNASLLARFFNSNIFFEKNTFLAALFYLVFCSFFESYYQLGAILFSQTFLILTLTQLFRLEYNKDGRGSTFNTGFLLGLTLSLDPRTILLWPLLYLMVTRIRPFVLRESIIMTIGLIVPLIYVAIFQWYMYGGIILPKLDQTVGTQNHYFVLTLALYLIILLITALSVRDRMTKSSIRFRKNMHVLNLYLVFSLTLGVLPWVFFQQSEGFIFFVIYLALVAPFAELNPRVRWLFPFSFYLLLVLSFIRFFI